MRAIDTNIVVRLATNDDADQVALASAALAQGETFLSLTVCLETEWVLRSGYGLSSATIADVLTNFAGIDGIVVQRPGVLSTAITWLRGGIDFADAMHLASADGCTAMLSFDRGLAKAAKKLGTMPVVSP